MLNLSVSFNLNELISYQYLVTFTLLLVFFVAMEELNPAQYLILTYTNTSEEKVL